jgi:putative nucleotidyltransferase with HDIG domain
VLGLSVFSLFKTFDEDENFSMLDFWKHALGTAVCSELLAKRLKVAKPEEAFTCGLLHDIGKLVLHEIDAQRLKDILKEASKRETSFIEIEREWDLPAHTYLGEVIAAKWGLPQIIRLCIHYHHHDVANLDTVLSSAKPMIQIVRLANQITIRAKIGKSGDCSAGTVTADMLRPLGIHMGDLESIEEQLKKDMERAGAFLSAYR